MLKVSKFNIYRKYRYLIDIFEIYKFRQHQVMRNTFFVYNYLLEVFLCIWDKKNNCRLYYPIFSRYFRYFMIFIDDDRISGGEKSPGQTDLSI